MPGGIDIELDPGASRQVEAPQLLGRGVRHAERIGIPGSIRAISISLAGCWSPIGSLIMLVAGDA